MLQRILFPLLLLSILAGMVFAQDGIPDNCENAGSAYYRPEVFARYEPQHQRLVLVNWNTGDDVLVLATGLGDTLIRGWSSDCHYLAVASLTNGSYSSIVYDSLTAERMGEVAGANSIPHPISWGFGDYLVVESRTGATLWNVSAYQQIALEASWNDTTNRNFSRLRWDSEHYQLIANLAVGGRIVYDINTGQIIPQVAENTDSIGGEGPQIVIGGAAYDCVPSNRYGYRQWFTQAGPVPGGIFLKLNTASGDISLQLSDGEARGEILVMLEANSGAAWIRERGWSGDCRYIAASLGHQGEDASDTYVWDVTTGQRVGIIADAREIQHPLYWHPAAPYLLVETGEGAILWHLPSNHQMRLNEEAAVAMTGSSDVRNFNGYQWLNNQLALNFVGQENTVSILNISDGQVIERYQAEGIANPSFLFSPDASYLLLCCGVDNGLSVINRQNGSQIRLKTANPQIELWRAAFSTDNRYLAYGSSAGLLVWDIQNPAPDGSPSYHHPSLRLVNFSFVDGVHIAQNGQNIDVRDGLADFEYSTTTSPVTGENGSGGYEIRVQTCGETRVDYDYRRNVTRFSRVETDTLIYEFLGGAWFSPDCRWIIRSLPFVEDSNAAYDDAPMDDGFRDRRSRYLVILDANTGQEQRRFPNPYRYGHGWVITWSPAAERALIRTTEGYFLYHFESDTATLLTYNPAYQNRYSGINTYFSSYWDYARGQVLVTGWSEVFAFDMQTGQERFRFDAYSCDYHGCYFSVSADNQFLTIFGFYSASIWNMDTLESRFISKDAGYRFRACCFAVNPTGDYAVYFWLGRVYRWDLENLPEDFWERDPNISWAAPSNDPESLRFIDEQTLEIVYEDSRYQMNILTGEYQQTP